MKYFINQSIHCHRLIEHILEMNYREDLNSHGKSKAEYNYKEDRDSIKDRDLRTQYELPIGAKTAGVSKPHLTLGESSPWIFYQEHI